jgi:thioredoxin reductase (NADPH)
LNGAETGQACYRDRVAAHQRIEIRLNTTVNEILGETKVTGLRLQDSSTGVSSELETTAVFAYVGLQPNNRLLEDRINLDFEGRIPTDGWTRTELVGICAAGNVRC